jgi:hypothetical protein
MALRLSALRAGSPFTHREIPGTHFYYRLSRLQGHSAAGRIRSIEAMQCSKGIPCYSVYSHSFTLVGIAQSHRNYAAGIRIPATEKFSLRHSVQTGSWEHATSYPKVIVTFLYWVKRPEREADHSPPTNAEVKKT